MPKPLVNIKVTQLFFDRPRVTRAVDRAKRQALSKSGAAIRVNAKRAMEASARVGRIAESSLPKDLRERRMRVNKIRSKKGQRRLRPLRKSSRPGEAPAAPRSSPLNKLTFFSYDPRSDSVVVGPVGFRNSTAPNTLEFGGRATVTRRRRRPRNDGKRVIESRRVRIEARPYMGPALKKELPGIPRAWSNSVRGG